MTRLFPHFITLTLVLACAGAARAQGVVVGDGAALYDPEGVIVDPNGAARTVEQIDADRLRELQRRTLAANPQRERVEVSLPKLIAAAAQHQKAGQPIPDDVRYLRGLVKIDALIVDPANRDIRLAGFAEPIEKTDGHRAVGATSGRAMLQLDDVVVALRLLGAGRSDTAFGCTIQLSPEGAARFVEEFRSLATDIVAARHRERAGYAQKLADAAGDQTVEFYRVPGDTRIARVCFDADYLMKRLALGLEKSPVPMPSYVSMLKAPDSIIDRFWFQSAHEPVAVAEEGGVRTYQIRGPGVLVFTREHFADPKPQRESAAADRFALIMNVRLHKLTPRVPAFADLANVSDLSLAAALIGRHRLHESVGWDMAAAVADDAYTPVALPTPKTVPMLATFKLDGAALIFTGGGVRLDYADAVNVAGKGAENPPAAPSNP